MATGACGINCDLCKLRLLGTCSTCGSGKSVEALKKLEAQKRIFNGTCTILECACMNKIHYCFRDCNQFPCENFSLGPYPFSAGFLDMQQRRRKEIPPALTPNGKIAQVPSEYWDKLQKRDIKKLCDFTLANPYPEGSVILKGLVFKFLNEDILVDFEERCLKRLNNGNWAETDDKLLELVTLVYFTGVNSFHSIGNNIVGIKDLKEAHYFNGKHMLKLDSIVERYGDDIGGFKTAAEYLDGKPVDMADSGFMLLPFPRIPLYYLFWIGDEEFKPRISLLFDRSIEKCLGAPDIWCIVSRVTQALLMGPL
jgi:hypothetical protein